MTSDDEFVLQLLTEKGLLDSSVLSLSREKSAQKGGGEGPLDALIADEVISHVNVAEVLAGAFDLEMADLGNVSVTDDVLAVLDYKLANEYKVFPLAVGPSEVELAIYDPMDAGVLENVGHIIGRSIKCFVAPLDAIESAIERNYGVPSNSCPSESSASELSTDVGATAEDDPTESEEEAPIIRYIQMLISDALHSRASDIHLEPLERRFRVRYRIDGVLKEVENPSKRLQPSIISRIKLMSHMSIAEKRVPQDGRIKMKVGEKPIDLRVSTLPTAYGESIVMRILDKEGFQLGLSELGFSGDDQIAFERVISLADGVFLVTGPTGSGKTTTLYSALNSINHSDRKIITVEDPVEYEITGVNQVQVRREVGMTFSAALRSILRQAPNTIMVGEIRDKETAEIAINAALTGHMVFSTLHTNDAPGAVNRLIDIGVQPFLVAAALRGVIAQRLIRRNCPNCRTVVEPDVGLLKSLGISAEKILDARFMAGEGCAQCNRGFHGRIGIFEMLNVNDEIQNMIYEGASLASLRRQARQMGMCSMREDGIRKVISGVTTLNEVLHATISDSD